MNYSWTHTCQLLPRRLFFPAVAPRRASAELISPNRSFLVASHAAPHCRGIKEHTLAYTEIEWYYILRSQKCRLLYRKSRDWMVHERARERKRERKRGGGVPRLFILVPSFFSRGKINCFCWRERVALFSDGKTTPCEGFFSSVIELPKRKER